MNKYLLIIVAILSIGLYFSIGSSIQNKKDLNRVSYNYSQVDSANSVLTQEYYELKSSDKKKIDSLIEVVNTKPKFIKEYVNIYITDTITDTVFVNLKPSETDPYAYKFLENKDCFVVGGVVSVKDSVPSLTINKLEHVNDIDYIVYLERRRMQWWIIKYRSLTKKDARLEVISECGTAEVKNIKLIK